MRAKGASRAAKAFGRGQSKLSRHRHVHPPVAHPREVATTGVSLKKGLGITDLSRGCPRRRPRGERGSLSAVGVSSRTQDPGSDSAVLVLVPRSKKFS